MNTVAIATRGVQADNTDTDMSFGRVLGIYLKEAKYESVRTLRMPAFAAPFLLLPALLYLLFAVLLAVGGKDPHAGPFLFVGFAVFGVMGPGMFGFGIFLAMERDQGLLTLRRALPMPPAAFLLAKLGMSMLFAAIIMVIMIAAAVGIAHLPLSAGQYALISLIVILGALPFCAMGLLIATLASGKSAPAYVNLLYLPMIYLSGFLFPLPKSIRWIAQASPAYHLDQLGLSVVGLAYDESMWMHVAVLVGVTVLLGAYAARRLTRG